MQINYAIAIMRIYPDARPSIDFSVCLDVDERQYISEWNYNQPQPTETELGIAWNEYVANPPEEPLSQIDLMQKAIDDLIFGGML